MLSSQASSIFRPTSHVRSPTILQLSTVMDPQLKICLFKLKAQLPPSLNPEPTYVALALLPVLPYLLSPPLAFSYVRHHHRRLRRPRFRCLSPPQPSHFQLDDGIAMDMDEPPVLNATAPPPLHVNPFPPVESSSSSSTSAIRAQSSKRSKVAVLGKRTRESSAEGDKRVKKVKVGSFPNDLGRNSSDISCPTSAIQSPEGAPAWFRNALQMFQSDGVALGEEWSRLLRNWAQFGDQSAYTSHEKLGTLHRPKVVKDWIQRARPATWRPVIDNVADLEKSYSMWWASLQPAWRHFEDGSLRTDLVDGDWSELRRPGVNGILNVLVVLFYWGLLVVGDNEVRQRWLLAVEDCTMVLNHLI